MRRVTLWIANGLLLTVIALGHKALANEPSTYTDKNDYFSVIPPSGWIKKEFEDPRSKVSFDVPAPVAGQNRAGLFFLSHPLTREVNVQAEAQDRLARLKQMGSPDARVTTVDFAGVEAAQVDGQMGKQNAFLRALMFTNYGRSYTISFTATKQDFAQYWPLAEEALKTFKCIPPKGVEVAADKDAVQKQKIRVWITALKEADLGTDAVNSLVAIGKPAMPELEEAERSGTVLQRQRAADIIRRIRASAQEGPAFVGPGFRAARAAQAEDKSTRHEASVSAAPHGAHPLTNEARTATSFLSSWPAFLGKLAELLQNGNLSEKEINDVFDGKMVTWEGIVKEIKKATSSDVIENVRIEMGGGNLHAAIKSLRPNVADDRITAASCVGITPGADEQGTWASVKVGNTVVFSATLAAENDPLPPKSVLGVMVMQNPQDDADVKIIAWINTKGGSCITTR